MTGTQLATAARLLVLIAVLQLSFANPQSSSNAQTASSLQKFFQSLVEHYNPSALPKFEELMKVEQEIAGLHPEQVTKALPVVFAALAHRDINVKLYAASALFAISLRPDSTALLRDHLVSIGDLLNESDPWLQATASMVTINLRPTPPPAATTLLLNYLKRTDRDQDAQGSAIFTLVRIAPENPEVLSAIQQFLARDLDSRSRIGVLNALGYPSVKDVRIISMVIAEMEDSDQGIKITAIHSVTRMGKDAVRQAQPTLQRLSDDPKRTAEVRAAAKEALLQIQSPDH
jgi:HEAT repeat protein